RDAAALHVITGIERGHATEVAALRTVLRARAPDHVVDLGGLDVIALLERTQHGRAEPLRMDLRQRPLRIFAHSARRAAGINNEGFGHGCAPWLWLMHTDARGASRVKGGVRFTQRPPAL